MPPDTTTFRKGKIDEIKQWRSFMAQYNWLVAAVFLVSALVSCNGSPPAEPKPARQNVASTQTVQSKDDKQDKPKEKKGGLIRQRELIEMRPDFQQIGLAYNGIIADSGKPPQSKEDFRKYLKAPKIMKYFDENILEFYYGVSPLQMPDGSSRTIVGYEPNSDQSGQRLVIMGDGSVQTISDADYAKAPKAKR
jgi:hypothetical protein